jgi:hypothetical protein
MKIRTGFVSNSSGTSFIVVFDKPIVNSSQLDEYLYDKSRSNDIFEIITWYAKSQENQFPIIINKLVVNILKNKDIKKIIYDFARSYPKDEEDTKNLINSKLSETIKNDPEFDINNVYSMCVFLADSMGCFYDIYNSIYSLIVSSIKVKGNQYLYQFEAEDDGDTIEEDLITNHKNILNPNMRYIAYYRGT